MKAPDIQEKYTALGLFTRSSTPEQVLDTIKAGMAEMREIVKAAGIQPE
jgi:tripartite-type tricarboxylate transporter receptor subunit TctC